MGKTVSDLLLYKGLSLKDAVLAACEEDLQRFKADVGVVALDLHGETVFHFNTGRMYRGKINDEGESVEIY
jgi:beta-aspartyl-peptidase (threonine type)